MSKGVVIAGSYAQYLDWLYNSKELRSNWYYANTPENIAGLHHRIIMLVGEYWLNPVYNTNSYKFATLDNEVISNAT